MVSEDPGHYQAVPVTSPTRSARKSITKEETKETFQIESYGVLATRACTRMSGFEIIATL